MTPQDADTIAYAGIAGQRQLLTTGAISSTALLDLSLERIARLDPGINAFRTLFASARAEAEAADAALARGEDRPLLGVPIAIKDNVPVAGQSPRMGTGSPEPVAVVDGTEAARLRAAGAVLVGATQLPELALWPFTESTTWGSTRNPWDRRRTPGGSSGGSAAAVAAGLVAAAHGSDGGGSIRIPAACCGLVGLKPTRDLELLDHWHGLSVTGCLTRTVADTVTMLSVLQDRPLALPEPRPLRIAWSVKPLVPAPVHPDVVQAVRDVVRRLEALGHTTVPADPSYKGVQQSFLVRYAHGTAQDLAQLADPRQTEARTRAVAALGSRLGGRPLTRAMQLGDRAAQRLATLPGGADVLLTPTLGSLPRAVGSMQGLRTLALAGRHVPFTPAWNVTGQPALSVPAGLSADGLPLAVQLIGPPGSDGLLLSLAAQLEDWDGRRPPV